MYSIRVNQNPRKINPCSLLGCITVIGSEYEAPDTLTDQIENSSLDIIPYGLDALVFIVNKNNPINNLTTEQLIGIYTGQIKDWSEVGGDNGPIVAFNAITRVEAI
ncbi:MAG: substrate-binding domain-containing protein [Oscillospiraceae bacterium]|nr:substrate-binding domain-containing protein [Oscillospiraceae bacterium]